MTTYHPPILEIHDLDHDDVLHAVDVEHASQQMADWFILDPAMPDEVALVLEDLESGIIDPARIQSALGVAIRVTSYPSHD